MAQLADDERANSMGLFNTAEAFRLSAMSLDKQKVNTGFAEIPVRFLYFHALELYLKALCARNTALGSSAKSSATKPSD